MGPFGFGLYPHADSILEVRKGELEDLLTVHLHKFLHSYVLVGDISHVSYHSCHLLGELSSYPHPIAPMMVVGLTLTYLGCCSWNLFIKKIMFSLTLLEGTPRFKLIFLS